MYIVEDTVFEQGFKIFKSETGLQNLTCSLLCQIDPTNQLSDIELVQIMDFSALYPSIKPCFTAKKQIGA
jgi:hypothetical protein